MSWRQDSHQSARLTNNTRCPISNLVILTLRHLHEQLCDLVFDLHLSEDGCAVVGNGDITIGRDEDLVESYTSVLVPG